jgi:hypothetical protein
VSGAPGVLVADEPQKEVGMISAMNRKLTNPGKKILRLAAGDFGYQSVKFFQHRIHLIAIEKSVSIGVDISEHRETRVPYWKNAIQYSKGLRHRPYFLPMNCLKHHSNAHVSSLMVALKK